jgi:8-oxo-dGTP pyrophosphatase MutT (NUDIX family)
MRTAVRKTIEAIVPFDYLERDHREDALAWIDGGAPLYRTAKPATPPKHLVAYSWLVDPDRSEALLIDHRLAKLWLPTGGHIDSGEDPYDAAVRELSEELGIVADPLAATGPSPFFLTVTETAGPVGRHVDVSLWFAFAGSVDDTLLLDEREAVEARWWRTDELLGSASQEFDPHIQRATAKLHRLTSSR